MREWCVNVSVRRYFIPGSCLPWLLILSQHYLLIASICLYKWARLSINQQHFISIPFIDTGCLKKTLQRLYLISKSLECFLGHPVHYRLVLPPGLGGLILSYIFLSTISSNLRGTGLSISMWSMLVVLKHGDVIVQRDERISVYMKKPISWLSSPLLNPI